jgi:hypothetical protein
LWAVILFAMLVLLAREIIRYREIQRDSHARLREDWEVAELEALYDLDWEWPR